MWRNKIPGFAPKTKQTWRKFLEPKKMKINWKKLFHINRGLIPMNVAYFLFSFGKLVTDRLGLNQIKYHNQEVKGKAKELVTDVIQRKLVAF